MKVFKFELICEDLINVHQSYFAKIIIENKNQYLFKMESYYPRANLLYDSVFLEFISNSKYDLEFNNLKKMLDPSIPASECEIKEFFRKEVPASSISPRKLIPKSPVINTRKPMIIRKSIDSPTINSTPKSEEIPPFYNVFSKTNSVLKTLHPGDYILNIQAFSSIIQDYLGLPSFFAVPFMISLDPSLVGTGKFEIPYSTFSNFAVPKLENATLQEKIFRILLGKQERNYLIQNDFSLYVTSLIQSHKSLKFLENETALISSYAKCIIARIFYTLDPEFRGRINFQHFANSNFCDCLIAVDTAPDVSDVVDFFSYEHFYVLLTKFWELDIEEKGKIDIDTLSTYDENRISKDMCRRLIQQLPSHHSEDEISFADFVYFVLAVEDKTTDTALRVWYRVSDLDDDGILSMYEIRRLYSEQKKKMIDNGMDPVSFKFVLSQILDMIGDVKDGVSISKLRDSGKQDTFFNILLDFKKFNEWEFRDPLFEMNMNVAFTGMKPWDIFCQLQYARLSASQDDNDDTNDDDVTNNDDSSNSTNNSNEDAMFS